MANIGQFHHLCETEAWLSETMLQKRKIEFVHSNQTDRRPDYRGHYTADTRRIVGEVYREDVERFGFEFGTNQSHLVA